MTYYQSVGWFGYAGYPNSARPWQTKQLWDWSGCCSMDVQKNRFFGLVSALFGYTVCSLHIGVCLPGAQHNILPVMNRGDLKSRG